MQVEFSNIPISLDAMLPQNSDMFVREVAKACGIKTSSLDENAVKLLRRSIDARKKSNVHFVVSVAINLPYASNGEDLSKLKRNVRKGISVKEYDPPKKLDVPDCSSIAKEPGFKRPVVVGAGPAGLFCALYLAKAGLQPIVVERGKPVEDRIRDVNAFAGVGLLDPNSNVQFGEGGAGTFSDGKLNTGTKSPHIRHVLETFVEAGAPPEILVDAKPHIGTDRLAGVVKNLRKTIEGLGGEFRFSTIFTGLPGTFCDLRTGDSYELDIDTLVLAIGHSARDTYAMLRDFGVAMERKPFAVGVRIEHLQSDINRAQYGQAVTHPALGAADYKLAAHNADGRGVYTFCMCPGGTVVAASSEPEHLCVNGMSVHARDGANANSALLVEVHPDDFSSEDVLAGVKLQRQMEHAAYVAGANGAMPYTAPAQTVGDFCAHSYGHPSKKVVPSYPRGVSWADLHDVLPEFVAEAMEEAFPALDKKLAGFADPEAVLTGVEPRSSSPVRIIRDKRTCMSVSTPSLYPAGEGAGYAGGIMSAATDGLAVAEAIVASLLVD